MPVVPAFHLRNATPDDLALAYTITEDAMRAYVEQTWGRWDPQEQLDKHRANYTPDTHRIVMLDEAPAGLVAVEELPTHTWLVKLYLLAAWRNCGIGARLLQGVLQAARAQGKPVRLRVLKVNTPAQRLYARHGFRVIEQTPERLFMERLPMHVTLREITSDTVRAVTKLPVHPSQTGFVATNAVSLAQALFSDEAWYRAVYADDVLVGFVMLADETLKKAPPAEPSIGLWRLMIDANHQRRGIGREVIRLVLEYVRSRPGVRSFYTSYVPEPGGPEAFYLGLGFKPNGEMDEDEVVLVYPLRDGRA